MAENGWIMNLLKLRYLELKYIEQLLSKVDSLS